MNQSAKPGIKTTEFWLAVSIVLPAVVEGVSALVDGKDSRAAFLLGVSALVSSVYTFARMKAKELANESAGSASAGAGSNQVSGEAGGPTVSGG
jgi:hypothetical protein